jgi:hypothetical protein
VVVIDIVKPTPNAAGVGVIDQGVAVVIDAITDFIGAGVNFSLGVIAIKDVIIGGDSTLGLETRIDGGLLIAKPVPIGVDEKLASGGKVQGVIIIVEVAVAVVVDVVTHLDGVGVDRRVGVIAFFAGGEAVSIDVSVAHSPITIIIVVIVTVGLKRTGVGGVVGVIAIKDPIPISGVALG